MNYNLKSLKRRRSKSTNDLIVISAISLVVFILSCLFELFEVIAEFSLSLKNYWVDELLVVLIILPVAFAFYSMRRWQELNQEVQLRRRIEELSEGQNQILEMITVGDSLPKILEALALLIERQTSDSTFCAIMLLNSQEQKLRLGTAPNLPKSFTSKLDGAAIGPKNGSCGTAAFLGKPVFVSDIANDPLWADYRGLALSHGLRASWCMPILSNSKKVLGTFAMYYKSPKIPTPFQLQLIEAATHIAGIAIERKQAFEQIKSANTRLSALSQQLVETQEVERRYIARELHDQVGQALTALKINLQVSQNMSLSTALSPHLEEGISIVESTLQQVRTMSLDLRPSLLDDLGLLAAMRWYIDRFSQRTGIILIFNSDLQDTRFPTNLETTCFRIAQEALTNIARHAKATRVEVNLFADDEYLQLSIYDNGIGFDVQKALEKATGGASLGLLGMQERAILSRGQLIFESAPAAGTRVKAKLSLEKALSRE